MLRRQLALPVTGAAAPVRRQWFHLRNSRRGNTESAAAWTVFPRRLLRRWNHCLRTGAAAPVTGRASCRLSIVRYVQLVHDPSAFAFGPELLRVPEVRVPRSQFLQPGVRWQGQVLLGEGIGCVEHELLARV